MANEGINSSDTTINEFKTYLHTIKDVYEMYLNKSDDFDLIYLIYYNFKKFDNYEIIYRTIKKDDFKNNIAKLLDDNEENDYYLTIINNFDIIHNKLETLNKNEELIKEVKKACKRNNHIKTSKVNDESVSIMRMYLDKYYELIQIYPDLNFRNDMNIDKKDFNNMLKVLESVDYRAFRCYQKINNRYQEYSNNYYQNMLQMKAELIRHNKMDILKFFENMPRFCGIDDWSYALRRYIRDNNLLNNEDEKTISDYLIYIYNTHGFVRPTSLNKVINFDGISYASNGCVVDELAINKIFKYMNDKKIPELNVPYLILKNNYVNDLLNDDYSIKK